MNHHSDVNTRSAGDFAAAVHETKSNLDVRRLMIVLSNALVPTLIVSALSVLTGDHYPPALAWLPMLILPLIGAALTIAGILITGILARCHYGLVVNSAKLRKAETGEIALRDLNWLGVSTNFSLLTALYAGAGLGLLCAAFGLAWSALVAGIVLAVGLALALPWNHQRANRRAASLAAGWQHGSLTHDEREAHVRMSLDATTSDVSVIVVMAIALFCGTFKCMTALGGINMTLPIDPSAVEIQTWGIPALGSFTLLALLLSGRMVVRLRIALAAHSQKLAELRSENDDPWRFNPLERTYWLFVLLHVLTSAAALILAWSLTSMWIALLVAGLVLIAGLIWYPWQLGQAHAATADETNF